MPNIPPIMIALTNLIQIYAPTAEFINPQKASISPTQGHLLMLLAKRPHSNSELAAALQVSKPAVTKAIKSLILHDYILAQPNPQDKRQMIYQLTASGQILASEHLQAHEAMQVVLNRTLADFNPDEQATIQRFLNQINTIARKDPS